MFKSNQSHKLGKNNSHREYKIITEQEPEIQEIYQEKVEEFEKHNPGYKAPEQESTDINIKNEIDKMTLMINTFGLDSIKKNIKVVKYYPK